MGGQDRVVWLDDRRGNLRCRIDTELKLALLAVVHGETLHQQCPKAGASATAERVEDQEALQAGAVVRNTADLVQDLVNELLAHGVVATSIIVGCIFLAGNHLLRVEELAVRAGADLVDDIGLEIAVDGAWDIFALA